MNELEKSKLKADIEYQEVLKWAMEEEDKIYKKLKAEGKLESGLDGNSEDYKYIYETVKWRMKEIIHKYNLPNKVKWSLET